MKRKVGYTEEDEEVIDARKAVARLNINGEANMDV
jgi:hypothetical protein